MRVLFISRNYPNREMADLGLWVEGLVRQIALNWDVRVVAPVPYVPPLSRSGCYATFRRIAPRERFNGVDVWHPRFLTGPGYSFHSFEATTYYWAVHGQVRRLFAEFPFDLIHAVFGYPDGVAAAWLARRYRVPLVITEQAPWRPWMDQYPRVRRKAVWASGEAAFHTAVSRSALDTVEHFTGPSAKLRVIPNGVDGTIFTPLPEGRQPDPSQIVYVGRIHRVKGVDVLLRAMRRLIDQRPHLRLVLVGGGFPYRGYQIEEESLRALAADLGLGWRVEFTGGQPPGEVARIMRESAVLVLPSRAESFGSVLVEALACGTPVVATRCGGPEDIVTDEVGVMVPPEDDEALAGAFAHVLDHRSEYPPRRLRAYALERFSWERVAGLTSELYREALRKRR